MLCYVIILIISLYHEGLLNEYYVQLQCFILITRVRVLIRAYTFRVISKLATI